MAVGEWVVGDSAGANHPFFGGMLLVVDPCQLAPVLEVGVSPFPKVW